MSRVSVLLICCLWLAACTSSSAFPYLTPAAPRTIIRNVTVIPMDRPGAIAQRDVVVVDDRIVTISRGGGIRTLPGDRLIDGAGKFLMPALWDMHAHVSATAAGTRLQAEEAAAITDRVLPRFIGYGVVGVRDPAITLSVLARLRAILDHRSDLPEFIASGPLMEGSRSPWSHNHEFNITTPEEGRRAVAEVAEAGVDFIKVYNRLSADNLGAVTAEARRRGLPISGHIPFEVSLRQAIDSGITGIEHLYVNLFKDCTAAGNRAMPDMLNAWIRGGYEARYRYFSDLFEGRDRAICAQFYREMADRGVFVTPVLSLELPLDESMRAADWDALPVSGVEACRATIEAHSAIAAEVKARLRRGLAEMLRALLDSGVGLMAGADTPVACQSYGHSLHKELQRLVMTGLSRQEALATATVNPARFLGRDDEGVVREGARANLLLLNANPLEDIEATLDIAGLMHDGVWRGGEELIRLREIDINRPRLYENGSVWTGDRFERRPVAVRGTRYIDPENAGQNVERIDLRGGYVVPPYANAHAHVTSPNERSSWHFLESGVFYAWNPNTVTLGPDALEYFERPDTLDVRISQGGITEPGGHPEKLYVELLGPRVYPGRTRSWFIGNAFHYGRDRGEIDAALDRLQEQRAHFVKVYLLHSEEYERRRDDPRFSGVKGLNPVNVSYITAAARARGFSVVAHVETVSDLRLAATSGVGIAGHMPLYWGARTDEELRSRLLTEEDASLVVRSGMMLVPTYALVRRDGGRETGSQISLERLFQAQARNITLLRDAGATFLIGTDGSGPIFEEVEHLVQIGAFTVPQALSITLATGRRLFPSRRIGCFDPGCEADFLVLAEDPSRDIAALRNIRLRVKAGQELTAPTTSLF